MIVFQVKKYPLNVINYTKYNATDGNQLAVFIFYVLNRQKLPDL